MTLEKIYDMGLIKDSTEIYIRKGNFHVIASGNWYQDNVLDHMQDVKISASRSKVFGND